MALSDAVQPTEGRETWEPEPGTLYAGLPETVYHASRGISKHGLDAIARSPAHYRYEREHRREPTEPMIVGSAIDCAVFEPECFDERFVVDDTDLSRNSKAWKAWAAGAGDREILRLKQHDKVRGMRDALMAHPTVSALLGDGVPQPSAYWFDTEAREQRSLKPTGVLCRGRLDWLCEGHSCAVDLKKTQDARLGRFDRTVASYRYHVQDAFYRAGLRACGHPVDHFVFVAIEEEPPHAIGVFELDPSWQRQGRALWERDLETYHQCVTSGDWPAYPLEPRTLEMPPWAERVAVS